MKKKRSIFILALCLMASVLTIAACGGTSEPIETEKLKAPTVALTDNVASWQSDTNAEKFEISIDGALSYIENTVTSKTLEDGQSFKVRAVGDGVNYSTSDWSNVVTYNAPDVEPVKLGTPAVTISQDGLCSWPAVENASGYVYKINGGAETSTTATSVQLTNGESIVVKAVGDGINYNDGEYSDSLTYTASTPVVPSGAPTYLGIFASNSEPSQAGGLPDDFAARHMPMANKKMRVESYRTFVTALSEYFLNSSNHFNASYPQASDYDVYARQGETVYIQIWLNNPSQYTILSLKLNGTKYQVGGGLSSFFINEDGQNYNCVYVAVNIPDGTYAEKTYTVTDIEYIANTYINADGTDEFMNNNDTVSIGLPYNAQNPVISDFNPTSLTVNSCSATLNVADISGLVNLSGGWLGIAVYDGYNIIANQSLTLGNNYVSAAGLVEDTTYWITVYLYADLHDGNGVSAHVLFEQYVQTPKAITVNEVEGVLLYNAANDGYYGAVKVNTALNSSTAEYIKLEIILNDQVVYTDNGYNGSAIISENILCGNNYNVRVYYKDNEYPDGKYVDEYAWVGYLGTPWYTDDGVYTFVKDAVYYFEINNNDENYPAVESFVLKLYNKDDARWYASDILYIIQNPTVMEDLEAQIDVLRTEFNEAYGNFDLMNQIHAEISALEDQLRPLESALWYLENRADNNRDIAYWQAEDAKGKYFYEFEYHGIDTDTIFKVGTTYYVVLDDVLTIGYDSLEVTIDYKYDKREGQGLSDGQINEGINIRRQISDHWVEMENVSYSDGELTLTLFNERDYWTGVGAPYEIGYVYKVTFGDEVLYIDNRKHEFNVNEDDWLNEYIQRILSGESIDGLAEKYVPDYEASYTIPVNVSNLKPGTYNFGVSIRIIGTDYEDDDCQATRWTESVAVYAPIEKPTIEFEEIYGTYYGVVTPDGVDNWYNDHYEYEAIDKDGNPVEIRIASESGYGRFYVPSAGTKVRVKIPASGYWLESEWSEWYTFDGVKLSAPELGEYKTDTCKVSWLAGTENVSHYLYSINGGTPVRVEINGNLSVVLNNGDVLRVKCVASDEGLSKGYLDSDWSEYTCTDTRVALDTPTGLLIENGMLKWNGVDGATYYIVERTLADGRIVESEVHKTNIGAYGDVVSFRVRAMTDDLENYRPGNFSESIANTSGKG